MTSRFFQERVDHQLPLKQRRSSDLGFTLHGYYTAVLVHCNFGTSNGRFHGVACFKDLVKFLELSRVLVRIQ